MKSKFFKPKQRVELHIDTERGILNLSTHVEHVTDAGEFIVAAPFYKGQLYPFLKREHVELYSIVRFDCVLCAKLDVELEAERIVLNFWNVYSGIESDCY